eukprot:scaffold65214_cov26-Phaeocystis_antarctica.AAC.1
MGAAQYDGAGNHGGVTRERNTPAARRGRARGDTQGTCLERDGAELGVITREHACSATGQSCRLSCASSSAGGDRLRRHEKGREKGHAKE